MAQGAEGTAEEIVQLLERRGEDVHQGQPNQVAGRWVEAGFEHPREVEAWLDAGYLEPEEARAAMERGEKPAGVASEGPEDIEDEEPDGTVPHPRDKAMGSGERRGGLDQA